MIRSIEKLFQFNVYQTREVANAAGQSTPLYSTTKPVKSWADPNPPTPDEFGEVQYLMIATTRGGCSDTPLVDANGKPYLRRYKMTPDEARTFNIPPKGDFPDLPQPKGEWNVPCRPLGDDEVLEFGFGGIPVVQRRNAVVPVSTSALAGASAEDIASIKLALEEIQANVAILVAKSK